jgi:hypothetical protein
MARRALEETWLRFAKGAAAVAVVLAVLAYASHDVSSAAWGAVLRAPAQQTQSFATNYGSGRLLPMN